MAGTLTISTLSDGTNSTSTTNCIQGSAKAWVIFNGPSPSARLNSFNVSSVTYNAVGDYTINFSTAMPDISYAVSACAARNYSAATSVAGVSQLWCSIRHGTVQSDSMATGYVKVGVQGYNFNPDPLLMTVVIHR